MRSILPAPSPRDHQVCGCVRPGAEIVACRPIARTGVDPLLGRPRSRGLESSRDEHQPVARAGPGQSHRRAPRLQRRSVPAVRHRPRPRRQGAWTRRLDGQRLERRTEDVLPPRRAARRHQWLGGARRRHRLGARRRRTRAGRGGSRHRVRDPARRRPLLVRGTHLRRRVRTRRARRARPVATGDRPGVAAGRERGHRRTDRTDGPARRPARTGRPRRPPRPRGRPARSSRGPSGSSTTPT